MPKVTMGPKIDKSTVAFYEGHFGSRHAGATYALEAFPALYRGALTSLKGVFTIGELSLMVDALHGTILTAGMAGQHLIADCLEGVALDGLADKWDVEPDLFKARLQGLTTFDAACLEVWAKAYWCGGSQGEKGHVSDYAATLAAPEVAAEEEASSR